MRFGKLGAVTMAFALIATPLLAQGSSESADFLEAVRERDKAAVEAILANPASTAINAREESSGERPIHIVTRDRDPTWLGFLLEHGARPDAPNRDGTTPLSLAVQIGWIEGAEQLLARRASVNAANGRGETPLILAVQRRDLAMVRLLLAHGADLRQTDHVAGMSALDYARQDPRAGEILTALEAVPAR
jgi:uncharacterized protein